MILPTQINHLQQALAQPLPGWAVQRRMAPENRRLDRDRKLLAPDNYRESSVLLLLYPNHRQLHFVLIRRPTYEGVHSGQIAFPGGRREGEESYEATALRETQEEIGILPEEITLLGSLSSIYIPPSNFMVYPFVGFVPAQPIYRPDEREVAEILEPSLSLLTDEVVRRQEQRHFPNIGWANVPYFDIFGHKVWGATAMMLMEFSAIVTGVERTHQGGMD